MFGYSEAQIAEFGLTVGLGAFIAYMFFIIFQLAKESRAGRFGTLVMLGGLGLGMLGFLIKELLVWWMG